LAGFGAVDVGPETESFHADRAGFVERVTVISGADRQHPRTACRRHRPRQAFLIWDARATSSALPKAATPIFAPHTEQQIELLRFMRRRYTKSVGADLSGRGFRTLHEFINSKIKHSSFADLDADPAPEITVNALNKTCPVCVETLSLWTGHLRRRSRQPRAESFGARRSYVAGGIAIKILEKNEGRNFFPARSKTSGTSKACSKMFRSR